MKKTKAVSDYYRKLGKKSARARHKKLLEKAKVANLPPPVIGDYDTGAAK